MKNVDVNDIKLCWVFRKLNATISDYFIAIQGLWVFSDKRLMIIAVYAPQEVLEKRMLWEYLNHITDTWNGEFPFAFITTGMSSKALIALWKKFRKNKGIQLIEKLNTLEVAQKSKIKWTIEGDENSKYFHGILNKKRSQMTIRGILVDGAWLESLNLIKEEFLYHFKDLFDLPVSSRLILDMDFPNTLSLEQRDELEISISKEEFKRVVWDCGLDKGNSSFIALIPKIQDAKMVKDFRPISLIGNLYKIIAKILVNRLVFVLGDLVNEVQSAFVANRQILDGSFILNELIQWCKSKKNQYMVFKVDFEKAYDSIRWDFLDNVLKKFGFGDRWRGWVQSCLSSSRGSILVNGSPTKEFQFYKGLKQEDPLSPFLFILVMKSLHLSFQNVVNEGMFEGISIGSSVKLSHLLYAYDVVFMGQWSDSNIRVDDVKISQAAKSIGCLTFTTPFSYLGVKVGGNLSIVKSWDEIVNKLLARLSKWKMKMLSIGGRLTLLKSVLGSTPIYYMSLFKVPTQVLNKMKSIRSRFFNGADEKGKKSSWVSWKKVLAAKEK
nr:putative RNA-directed DNA polymerase, eukaryota, reverse transcriptase zinc-binding domain protein [Tanacetum cinerariifolium]